MGIWAARLKSGYAFRNLILAVSKSGYQNDNLISSVTKPPEFSGSIRNTAAYTIVKIRLPRRQSDSICNASRSIGNQALPPGT
jgi:hypothetical protein